MPTFFPLIFLLLPITVLVSVAVVSRKPFSQLLQIRRTPPSMIAAVPSGGLAAVSGQITEGTITSPIALQTCALWQIEIQELRNTGKSSHWKTVLKRCSDQPFTINDGTGALVVAPTGAEAILQEDTKESTGFFKSLSPEVEQRIAALGISTHGFLNFRRSLRVFERRVGIGEQIFAVGSIDRSSPTLLLRSQLNQPLILTDLGRSALIQKLSLKLGGILLVVLLILGFFGFAFFKLLPILHI